MNGWRRSAFHAVAGLGLLGLIVGPFPSCNQALLTAPPGSAIVLSANPPAIAAFGAVSVISAMVTEPTGTPAADGTVVQFFTTLGHIDEQGKTNDGVARVKLTSDSRSGTAKVTAYSGGSAASGSPGSGSGGGATSATFDVLIGAARPKRIVVTADPPVLVGQRWTTIAATVYDEQGDPAEGVPVQLTVTGANNQPATYESLDSGGAPLYTDNNGRVLDRMTTTYPRNLETRDVTVTATTSTGVSGTVVVTINTVGPAPTVNHILVVANPTSISAGVDSRITAYARDTDGTPVPGVALIFTVALAGGGPTSSETLASGSRPITTGAEGTARDTLRTTYVGPPSRTVAVTVTAPNGISGSVNVLIN